jgi:hypothetical protein
MRDDTLRLFASFENGMAVFSEMLTIVLDAYELFVRVLTQASDMNIVMLMRLYDLLITRAQASSGGGALIRHVSVEQLKGVMQTLVSNFLTK